MTVSGGVVDNDLCPPPSCLTVQFIFFRSLHHSPKDVNKMLPVLMCDHVMQYQRAHRCRLSTLVSWSMFLLIDGSSFLCVLSSLVGCMTALLSVLCLGSFWVV